MIIKLIATVTFINAITNVIGGENVTENEEASNLGQEKESSCDQTESWGKFKHDSKEIKGVCIRMDYQKNEPPMKESLTPLFVLDHVTKISNINEKTNSLQLDIKMRLIWEDSRIKSEFADYMEFRRLPPIKKDDSSPIWAPITEIENLKSLNFLNDPIKYHWVLLFLSSPAYPMFPLNKTLIHTMIEWHVTVSCEFDFSNYPLDDQKCGFRMWLYDSMVSYVDMPLGVKSQLSNISTTTHGFEVVKVEKPTKLEGISGTLIKYGIFGYDIDMKRIIRPYLYQYYLPCVSIVVASHLSFIVPISATPGRIALVVTMFLTLTNLFINQKVSRMNVPSSS